MYQHCYIPLWMMIPFVGTIFMDLSKAFDIVNYSILLQKLTKYSIGGEEMRWFLGYLHDRKQRVCMKCRCPVNPYCGQCLVHPIQHCTKLTHLSGHFEASRKWLLTLYC